MHPRIEALLAACKQQARRVEHDTLALWIAYRDQRVPWYARAFALLVVACAFSPIDLVPDFIPVLGHLDDLLLVPLGIMLALRMIPPQVMAESRERAAQMLAEGRPRNWVAAGVIVALWLALAALAVWLVLRAVQA